MKKKINLLFFSLFSFVLFFSINNSTAQSCNCNHSDPYGLGNACNTQYLEINGAIYEGVVKVCGTTSSCGSGAVNYTVNLSSTQLKSLTGYYWVITGGGGTACYNGISSTSGGGRQQSGFTSTSQISANINWISATTSTLEFYGYTGWSAAGAPTTLSYYSCVQVTIVSASSVPATPTSIYIGAPQCSVKGYMFNVGPCASNVTSYTWTGAGSGTYPICEDGPVLIAGQWPNQAYFCVKANNACGSSGSYCTYVNVPSTFACYAMPAVPHLAKPSTDETENNINALKPFEIYPNPANDKFIINLPTHSDYNIQIINGAGQVVKNLMISNADTKELSVSELSAGLYFVIIKLNGKPVSQKKILIQR